jgi:hypothetical protein
MPYVCPRGGSTSVVVAPSGDAAEAVAVVPAVPADLPAAPPCFLFFRAAVLGRVATLAWNDETVEEQEVADKSRLPQRHLP